MYRLPRDIHGDAWRFTSNYQVISVVEMTNHQKLGWPFFSIRAAELKTVLLKFNDMLGDDAGAAGDGRGGGRGGGGRGGGRGSGRGDAAGAGETAARWKSRRVQKDPRGVLDATARAAAEHARSAAQHAVDVADRDARLAARRGGS
jgi:hypothetical protein